MVAVLDSPQTEELCPGFGRDDDDLRASIVAKHAQMCAMHRSLLADIAEHDARQAWQHFGTKSEIDYLIADLGLVWRTAKTWVHAANTLARRPEVGERYRRGDMSFDQLTSIVDMMAMRHPRIITPIGPFEDGPDGGPTGDDSGLDPPDNPDGDASGGGSDEDPDDVDDPEDHHGSGSDGPGDESPTGGDPADPSDPSADPDPSGADLDGLLDLADRLTPGQLAALARKLRRRSDDEANAAHRRRHLKATLDSKHNRLHLEGDLFDDAAATVWAALLDFINRSKPDPATGSHEPVQARFADALVEMAHAYLNPRNQMTSRPAVFIHTDVSVLTGEDGWAEATGYSAMAAETVRRMACFADLVPVIDDRDGNPLILGRSVRTPTWRQAEMVRHRDGGCRFPGCGRTMFVECHHVKQWDRDVGATDYGNLALLCSRDHHRCHEGGWTISGDPNGELIFTDPTGTIRLSSWPEVGARLPV